MSSPSNGGSGPGVESSPVVVKKYANRRLYNTESSSYITLENVAAMVREGRDFAVYDAKSGEDITRGVLTQIIVEEEAKGRNLLATGFLRQLIGFYGDSLQSVVPRYLEQALTAFAGQQEKVRDAMKESMGGLFPFRIDEVSRQNMAMFERAMSLFFPFYQPHAEPQPPEERIAALQAEVESLRRQLAQCRQDAMKAEVNSAIEERKTIEPVTSETQ
jgi:polyhydroxyalkanoate synthesis repressor PhaR